MKKYGVKSFLCIILLLMLMCISSACSKSEQSNSESDRDNQNEADNEAAKSNKLYDKGLELVNILDEMASSEEYRKLYSADSLSETIEEIAKSDYNTPKAVYKIEIAEEQYKNYLVLSGLDTKSLSDSLLKNIIKKAFGATAVQISAESGTQAIAVVGVLSATSLFVCESLTQPVIYVYKYADSYPVAVCFIPGEDGAVSASANYLISDDLKTAGDDAFEEFLKQKFAYIGIIAEISILD